MKFLYNKYKEIINYLIVGGLTTLVSLAIYYGCVFTFFNPQIPLQLQAANIISWCGAVAFAYITNRKFVFESHTDKKIKEIIAFISARLLTLFIDMFMMFLLVSIMKFDDKISKLIVQVIVIIVNYLLSKFVVFKNKN